MFLFIWYSFIFLGRKAIKNKKRGWKEKKLRIENAITHLLARSFLLCQKTIRFSVSVPKVTAVNGIYYYYTGCFKLRFFKTERGFSWHNFTSNQITFVPNSIQIVSYGQLISKNTYISQFLGKIQSLGRYETICMELYGKIYTPWLGLGTM